MQNTEKRKLQRGGVVRILTRPGKLGKLLSEPSRSGELRVLVSKKSHSPEEVLQLQTNSQATEIESFQIEHLVPLLGPKQSLSQPAFTKPLTSQSAHWAALEAERYAAKEQ